MIVRLRGTLSELTDQSALVDVGAITYEVLLPGYALQQLGSRLGKELTLHVMELYEANTASGNITPRLIGFLGEAERRFFGKFISVKGLGVRRALRALVRPVAQVAAEIESGNSEALQQLPEVGRRTAEQIIAELRGKVGEFAVATAAVPPPSSMPQFQREALEILLQLGERRNEAEQLIAQVMAEHPKINACDELVQEVYRVKMGTKV